MWKHVLPQASFISKPFATDCAAVWLLPCLNYQMFLHMMFPAKPFTTDWANGFSHVWVLMCLSRDAFRQNFLPYSYRTLRFLANTTVTFFNNYMDFFMLPKSQSFPRFPCPLYLVRAVFSSRNLGGFPLLSWAARCRLCHSVLLSLSLM